MLRFVIASVLYRVDYPAKFVFFCSVFPDAVHDILSFSEKSLVCERRNIRLFVGDDPHSIVLLRVIVLLGSSYRIVR